jgi:hypothetical protein
MTTNPNLACFAPLREAYPNPKEFAQAAKTSSYSKTKALTAPRGEKGFQVSGFRCQISRFLSCASLASRGGKTFWQREE